MKKILIGAPEFMKNIDWTELRNQKTALLNVIARDEQASNELTGILHLIDAIQDFAVDEMEIPEMYVYDFELEENRENETDEERFARESAETVYELCTEGDSIHIDDENNECPMGEEFINSIINDDMHADIMRADIRQAILKGVTEHPEDFEKDENGKFCYDYRLCEDFGGIIDNYLKDQYESTHTRTIQLCNLCASDNVQERHWINVNTGKICGRSVEENDYWCDDCGNHVQILQHELPLNKKLIGFQVRDVNSGNVHPHFPYNYVYTLSSMNRLLKSEFRSWKLCAVWSGDIEDVQVTFEGDPRQ